MLKQYAKKRNFTKTSEPKPARPKRGKGPLTFVVQKHAASHLHYDFRLELDGVLLSWAVPKGPSLNPDERRLAMKVEDHPLDYGGFEGTIPKGEYGGGSVMVWDRGEYFTEKAPGTREAQEKELRSQLKDGKMEILLDGQKLKGGFVLIHTDENRWLLIKRHDEFTSDCEVTEEDRSVLSGRKIGEIDG
jgi:bifunctional non-homologous end joining protein LigD